MTFANIPHFIRERNERAMEQALKGVAGVQVHISQERELLQELLKKYEGKFFGRSVHFVRNRTTIYATIDSVGAAEGVIYCRVHEVENTWSVYPSEIKGQLYIH